MSPRVLLLFAVVTACSAAPPPPPVDSSRFAPALPRIFAEPVAETFAPGARPSSSNAQVIVYGTISCAACYEVKAYCQSKGLACEHRDVERDPYALDEMMSKLSAAGLPGGSIPVLDVGGRMLVGFSPAAVDAALAPPR